MDTPIFQTQKTGKIVSVSIFKDKLTYSNKLDIILGTKTISLDEIEQTAFVPKEPGADPQIIDLAIKTKGEVPTVLKDLNIIEAKQIQDILKQHRLDKRRTTEEQHPFTQAGRIIKTTNEKKNSKSIKPVNNLQGNKTLNLPFRRKVINLTR